MKNWLRNTTLLAIIAAFAAPLATQALVSYPPAALLQPGDITGTMIRNGAITDTNVSATAAIDPTKLKGGTGSHAIFYDNGANVGTTSQLTESTTAGFTNTGTTTLAATTTINGQTYYWPGSAGGANYNLTTNGSGTLSWAQATPSQLLQSFTAGEALGATSTVYLKKSGTITADNSAAWNETTTFSNSYTMGTCSNNILLVSVQDSRSSAALTFTTFTYGGQQLYQLIDNTADGWNDYIYYATSTPTGANTLTIAKTGGSGDIDVTAVSKCGVAQTSQPDASSAVSDGTTLSTGHNITTQNDGSFVVMFTYKDNLAGYQSSAPICASAANWNYLQDALGQNSSGYYSGQCYGEQYTYVSPAGATTTTSNWINSTNYSVSTLSATVISLKPASSPIFEAFNASASSAATANSFVGFATAAASAGATVNVAIQGIVSGFVGLTGATQYYLSNAAGQVSTSAGTVTRKVGIAISSTQMLVTNIW